MTFDEIRERLALRYGRDEARAVARWLLEVGFGLTLTDIVCGAVERMDEGDERLLLDMTKRLEHGEPVQYVVGKADFGPRLFEVSPAVLIPRPETYELCQWIVSCWQEEKHTGGILDIGTGSGCIACTLAAELPEAHVTGIDISEDALKVARDNATSHGVRVLTEQRDALLLPEENRRWQVVVSNPPYICRQEADSMEAHVLEHEPHTALFVPNDDPLLFYRAIAHYSRQALCHGGLLFFELNPIYAEPCRQMLSGLGFTDITLRDDQYGKLRFIKARREQ